MSYLRFLRKIGGCMHFFQSYTAFKSDIVRSNSKEWDFSVQWHRNAHPFERWRVSWIQDTGEIYAVCFTHKYKDSFLCILLSKQPTLEFAQAYMAKATKEGNHYNKLVLDKVFTFIDWDKVDNLIKRV